MKLNWSEIKCSFNDDFLNFYNSSNKKRFLIEMVKYNQLHDTQGDKPIDDEALNKLDRWLKELDGTLLGDLVADFLRKYQIFALKV